jgi:hypothetical protein
VKLKLITDEGFAIDVDKITAIVYDGQIVLEFRTVKKALPVDIVTLPDEDVFCHCEGGGKVH